MALVTPFDEMVSYLGKEVWVRLTDDKPIPVSYTGTLISIEETGQIVLRMDDGFAVYCWPALEMVLVRERLRV